MKNIKQKEQEFNKIKQYTAKTIDNQHPGIDENYRDVLIRECTWGICWKQKKGYGVSTTNLGGSIAKNDLRATLKRLENYDLSTINIIVDIIDKTSANLEYKIK